MKSPPATGRIRRLDPRTASRIAAGEVLDRPVAALKELVENALDAGAQAIEITVDGGLDRGFEVADDGVGMALDELALSLERHATSKIAELADLERLDTLGFRGEALPSIAEVSRLTLTSRARDGGTGAYTLSVEGGTIRPDASPVAAARAPGTTVAVRDLFFNTPARRKFLRSPAGELRLAVRMLTAYALAFPSVALRLTLDGRVRLELPAAGRLLDRLIALYGNHFVGRLIEVQEARPGLSLEAWVGVPELARVTRDGQTLLVNRRWIQSPLLSQAVRQGYGNLIAPGRHPTAIVVLTVDPATLDVNVHPTKREIRFAHDDAMFGFLAQAVGRPLARLAPRYLPDVRPEPGPPSLASLTGEERRQPSLFSGRGPGGRSEPGAVDVRTGGATLEGGTGAHGAGGLLRLVPPPGSAEATGGAGIEGEEMSGTEAAGAEAPASVRLADLWQLHETYVLAPIAGGLLIVDQHAAHERILYEEALERFRARSTLSQQLLFPLLVDLSRDEFDLLLEVREALEALGFGITAMSPPTVVVRGVPPGIGLREPGSLLRDVLDGLGEGHGRSLARDEPWDRVAKSFACHAAVRAGERLNREEMNQLIDRLFATGLPHGDPHGRPTFVRVDLHELNQRFGRSD